MEFPTGGAKRLSARVWEKQESISNAATNDLIPANLSSGEDPSRQPEIRHQL
jgi:hypothetical protein